MNRRSKPNCRAKRIEWIALALIGWMALAFPVQAASFDCAKAQSKVEKMICADAEISKLDEKLAKTYSETSKDEKDVALLNSQQRAWLKQRNQCVDIFCLRQHYLQRIAELNETDSYMLVMSKDDGLCNHMLQLFNEDLKKFDRGSDQHDEFESIPWKPAQYSYEYGGRIEYTAVEGALFDFNNDGVLDFVVRDKSRLSGMQADLLFMLDSGAVKHANVLTVKELIDAKNAIQIAGSVYPLSSPLDGQAEALWLLSPFRYHDTSYLYMQSLYKGKVPTGDFAVIAKYGGGKFVQRDMTGKMEDICYIKRIGVNSIK